MIKSKDTATTKKSNVASQIAFMKEMIDSPWWKLVEKEFDKVISKIKLNIWIPCTDQSLKFSANNLLSERIAALFIAKNLPNILIDDFEQLLAWDKENWKTLVQRLEEQNAKLSKELQKYIKM